jgi:TonB family protein
MRRILIASLLLSPLATTAALASQPATDATASTQVTRISTGVVAPKLIGASNVAIPLDAYDTVLPKQVEVGVNLNVDENGNAQNVLIARPFNRDLDARVVAAVQKFHFRPASLDHQNIPVSLNLTVVVQH